MLDKAREEIANNIESHVKGMRGYPELPDYQGKIGVAMDILSIKLGSHTLGEIIQMIDDKKLVKLSENQNLPENFYELGIDDLRSAKYHSWDDCQKDMLKAGFRKVEPL